MLKTFLLSTLTYCHDDLLAGNTGKVTKLGHIVRVHKFGARSKRAIMVWDILKFLGICVVIWQTTTSFGYRGRLFVAILFDLFTLNPGIQKRFVTTVS